MISPLTPKSSSTPSSSRAFCSSASLETVLSRTMFFGSERKCSVGISNFDEPISEVCASRWTRAPGAGRGAGASTRVAASERKPRTCARMPAAALIRFDLVIFDAEIIVDVDRIDGHGAVGHHGGEEFGLDPGAAVGADAGLGALGQFDALGGAAPAARAVSLVDLELVVAAVFRRGAAQESPCRQPPMGDGAERQDAAVVFLLVVEGASSSTFCFRLGRRQDGEAVLAGVEAGAIGEKVEGRPDQQDRQQRGQKAGRIAAAGEDGRDLQHHVAEDAAEPGRQRPGLGRRGAAGDRSKEQRRAEPGGGALGQIVDAARRGEEEAPDHRRHEGGDGGEAEELHRQVGKDRARITHGVGDRRIGGVAEARIGDVPGAEAGEPEGDGGEKPDAGQAPRLAAQEGLKAMPRIVQRKRSCNPRTHVVPRDPIECHAPKRIAADEGEPIGGRLRPH